MPKAPSPSVVDSFRVFLSAVICVARWRARAAWRRQNQGSPNKTESSKGVEQSDAHQSFEVGDGFGDYGPGDGELFGKIIACFRQIFYPVSADADCVAGFVGVVDDETEATDGDGHGRRGIAGFTGPLVAAIL